MDDLDLQIPPHDLQMERDVLGCMMLLGAETRVSPQLKAEAFYAEPHIAIYETISKLIADGDPPDLVMVCNRMAIEGTLELAGGLGYITQMIADVANAHHADYYSRKVIELWAERSTYYACSMVRHGKMNRAELRYEIDQIEAATVGRQVVRLGEAIMEYEDSRKEERKTLRTGLFSLDRLLDGGMEAGALVILAARTGVGKTAFATSLLTNLVEQDKGALMCSLEMTRMEIVERMVAAKSGVPLTAIRRRAETNDQERQRFVAQGELYQSRIKLDDMSNTFDEIYRQAMRQQGTIDLLVVDYLQLVRSEARIPREQQVAAVSRGLKLLAKELEIPVLALAQMNRQVETRTDTRPKLSDLRESGAIEQDANIVMFLHRDTDGPETDRKLIIAKNRSGQTGVVSVEWVPQITAFRDIPQQVDTSGLF